jgi:protein-tyrosine phosphatase
VDFNRIDLDGIKPGWGSIWQGGAADQAVQTLPGPLLIVVMDRGEINEQFIQHGLSVEAVLAVWIEDSPDACLSDAVLKLCVDTVSAWLEQGGNVYDHCAAGVSRASYMDIAIHMHVMGWDFATAFAYVHAARPVANPNAGFVAQLERLGTL